MSRGVLAGARCRARTRGRRVRITLPGYLRARTMVAHAQVGIDAYETPFVARLGWSSPYVVEVTHRDLRAIVRVLAARGERLVYDGPRAYHVARKDLR